MTKFFVVMLLCGVAIQASYAQTEKGTQNLGLSLGASTSNGEITEYDYINNAYFEAKTKNNQYNIAASYSYFVADKIDLGLSTGYASSNYKITSGAYEQKQNGSAYFGSIFLRKYFLFNDKIGIRTGPEFAYLKNKTELEGNADQTQDIKEYNGSLRLDFVYFPLKKLGIASSIGSVSYSHEKITGYQPSSSNSFGIGLVNSLNLSFFYIFN